MTKKHEEEPSDPKEVQKFLERLSRDKHAFGAHLGMRVERDFSALEKHERAQQAAKAKKKAR